MFRLRTTTALSLLALLVGGAGTGWLSDMNTGWAGPSERVAGFVPRVGEARRLAPHPAHGAPLVARRHLAPAVAVASAPDEAPAPPPVLQPLAMPEAPLPWSQAEGHLDGRVLLHVSVDGQGQVTDASVLESSGDAVLDAHALASVRGWRFAVPADHPAGFSGELPMRYSGGSGQAAP